ncbi:glycosyltransferase [Emcibacteraceae bacterium]|nr:glycosyltransferase [Emcibacteraceae bacterium]
MDVLTITTLYPNELEPRHGIFIKNRLNALDELENFNRKVIAPVPHCPPLRKVFKKYQKYEALPEYENQEGIDVYHPKFITFPGGYFIDNATSMAKAAEEIIEQIYDTDNSFDFVDGQFLYPDGVAASIVAKAHKKPLILTARGSDVNYWMDDKKAREKILDAIDYAEKVICVSRALKEALLSYGVEEKKLVVIYNGVDPECFNTKAPINPLREEYYLTVGNLVPLKGHHITLNTFFEMPKQRLIIVGNGEQRSDLKKQAKDLGIQGRVQMIKHLDQKKLAEFYAGATATILMSSMEGMPNVVLESLAVGTPVVATNVGGIPEVINEHNGLLLKERDEYNLLNAMEKVKETNWNREEIAKTVKEFRWHNVAKKQFAIYQEAIS